MKLRRYVTSKGGGEHFLANLKGSRQDWIHFLVVFRKPALACREGWAQSELPSQSLPQMTSKRISMKDEQDLPNGILGRV